MMHTIKKYFIPHEENGYHPHILHTKRAVFYSSLAVIIKVIVVVAALSIPAPVFVLPDILALDEQEIIYNTNALRLSQGIPVLDRNAKLTYSAQLKTQDMADHQLFSHTASNGGNVSYFLGQAGYRYSVAGENLAMGYSSVSELMAAWKKSQTHYTNLVDTDYTETGVGIVGGLYNDIPTIFVAQHFGAPKESTVSTVSREDSLQEDVAILEDENVTSTLASVSVPETQQDIPVVSEEAVASEESTSLEVKFSAIETSSVVEDTLLNETQDVPSSNQEDVEEIPEDPATDEFSFYTEETSVLSWKEENSELLLTATVVVTEDVTSIDVLAQGYQFSLETTDGVIYTGTHHIDTSPKEFFQVILPARVEIVTEDGEHHIAALAWESVFIPNQSPFEKYTMAKKRLSPFMGFFAFSRYVLIALFVFFVLALAINIVVEWHIQHHHVILKFVALLGFLVLLYIV